MPYDSRIGRQAAVDPSGVLHNLLRDLNNLYGTQFAQYARQLGNDRVGVLLKRAVYLLGQLISKHSRDAQTAGVPLATPAVPVVRPASADLVRLVTLADQLDADGAHAMADILDEAAGRLSGGDLVETADKLDTTGLRVQADVLDMAARLVSAAEEDSNPVKPGNESSLSTRYCPDHRGVQTMRVSERIVQCPINGRQYNYETGYTDYKGQMVPGGSVAAQTPQTAPYAIPQRLYDSRQNVINTLN